MPLVESITCLWQNAHWSSVRLVKRNWDLLPVWNLDGVKRPRSLCSNIFFFRGVHHLHGLYASCPRFFLWHWRYTLGFRGRAILGDLPAGRRVHGVVCSGQHGGVEQQTVMSLENAVICSFYKMTEQIICPYHWACSGGRSHCMTCFRQRWLVQVQLVPFSQPEAGDVAQEPCGLLPDRCGLHPIFSQKKHVRFPRFGIHLYPQHRSAVPGGVMA